MHRLWSYDDYVGHLSHSSNLVRNWAYYGIEKQYPRRFCREVSRLIDDPDPHLACRGPQYLAKHGAVEFAPAILESFLKRDGRVADNCARALGKLNYEAGFEIMVDRMKSTRDIETLLGVTAYLGSIHTQESHVLLRDSFIELSKTYYAGSGVRSLISYGDPEDVMYVFSVLSIRAEDPYELKSLYGSLMGGIGAGSIYHDLMGMHPEDILSAPKDVLEKLLLNNPGLSLSREFQEEIVKHLENGRYPQLCRLMHASAMEIINERFPYEDKTPEFLEKNYTQNLFSIALLACLAGVKKEWNRFKKNEDALKASVSAAIVAYLSILERVPYLEALAPDAPLPVLMDALKNSGRDFPETISSRLVSLSPADALKQALTQDLTEWSDIHIVRIMGQIGTEAFVPDLLRVFRDADPLDFVYEEAFSGLYGIESSGHQAIFSAIRNNEIPDASTIIILLEQLPYSESYDIATRIWDDDEGSDFIEFEFYGHCLQGIGDKRGIRELQALMDDAGSYGIGSSLETLAVLHGVDIPELPMIREQRKEWEERRRENMGKLDSVAQKGLEKMDALPVQKTFIRSTPKVGRNDPCPCGSGRKYKKCCLNKNQ